ncbi:MAG: large conductance mechanosensitive channel protein MscL [Microthrixaceae bacterium]|nr:large conductance mechanosensitive channel protein MscL [Microthrixaceae bacterium]
MLKGFKDFIMRGNVVDMAIGIVIGGAFGAVVTSFTNNVLMAFVGAIVGKPNFNSLVLKLGHGKIYYGSFITDAINFLLVAAALYFAVVAPLNAMAERRKSGEDASEPTNEERVVELLEQIAAQGRSNN